MPRARSVRRYGSALVALVLIWAVPTLLAASRPPSAAAAAQFAWELVGDGDGPAARSEHTLAADVEGYGLVLFGGRDGTGTALGDTWRFDADTGTWDAIPGTGPAPRFGHAVAVDDAAGVFYLIGGQAGSTFFDDTWRYEYATDSWSQIDTTPAPAARYGHSAILTGDGQVVISHGFTFNGRFDDTWSLDPETGTWTDISPETGATRPLPRCLHEAVWDAEGKRMLLFGGCASGYGPCPLGDLWSFDPETREWTDETPAIGPAPRTNPALVLDSESQRAILLAGSTEAGFRFDTWTLDLAEDVLNWTEQPPGGDSPTPRGSLDATVLGDTLYIFGGTGDAGRLADLWIAEITED